MKNKKTNCLKIYQQYMNKISIVSGKFCFQIDLEGGVPQIFFLKTPPKFKNRCMENLRKVKVLIFILQTYMILKNNFVDFCLKEFICRLQAHKNDVFFFYRNGGKQHFLVPPPSNFQNNVSNDVKTLKVYGIMNKKKIF